MRTEKYTCDKCEKDISKNHISISAESIEQEKWTTHINILTGHLCRECYDILIKDFPERIFPKVSVEVLR